MKGKKPEIFDTVTRTCTIFAILGLATICLALIANVVFIGISIRNPPIPEIKSLIVTGLEKGAAKISVEIEFPGRRFADAFHLKMEGNTQITVGIETANRMHELASLSIKEGFNVNLASSQATKLILNDIELKFLDLKNDFITEILDLENGQVLIPKAVQLHFKTRLVTNSFLIPLGTSINWPYKIPLPLKPKAEPKEATSKQATSKAKNSKETGEKGKEKEELTPETKRKLAAFLPKRVHLSSTDQEFAIEIFESIPSDALPEFLFIQVPKIKFAVASKDKSKPAATAHSAITFEMDAFTLGNPKALNLDQNQNGRVEFGARLAVNRNIYKMAKLGLDDQLQNLELSAGVEEKFALDLPKGSFMRWLSQFQIHGTIDQITKFLENLNKKAQERKEEEKKTKPKVPKEPKKPLSGEMNFILRTLFDSIKVKLMKVRKDESNEKSIIEARIKILRKNIITKLGLSSQILIGQIPKIGFTISKVARGTGTVDNILAFNFESDEIQAKHKRINLKLSLSVFHFLQEKSDEGEDEFAKRALTEIKETEKIRIKFDSGNVFGQILSLGNCEILLTPQLKPERLQFLKSPRSISFIKPADEPVSKPEQPSTEPSETTSSKEFDRNRIDTSLVAKNEANAAIIAAKLTIKEHEHEPPIKVFASWGDFHFSVLMNELLLLEFEIKNGFLVAGPGFLGKGAIKFNLRIPSQDENMSAFKKMIKFLLEPPTIDNEMAPTNGKNEKEKSSGHDKNDIEITSSNVKHEKEIASSNDKDNDIITTKPPVINKNSIFFKFHFGSAKENYMIGVPLQLLKDLKDGKNLLATEKDKQKEGEEEAKKDVNKAEVNTKEEKKKDVNKAEVEKKEEKTNDSSKANAEKEKTTSSKEAVHISDQTKQVPSEQKKPKKPSEPTLLSELANSILQLATFQPPTLFFHINIPDKTYCSQTELSKDFNLKISASLALPVIEARLCARLVEGDRPEACLLRAGISRPLILTTEIVDGKICFAKFKILPPDNSLLGSDAIETSTKYVFNSNEAPIHASIESLPNLIRFSEEAAAKVPQILSLSAWDKAASINKVIGELGSAALAIKVPDDKKKVETDEKEGNDQADEVNDKVKSDEGKNKEKADEGNNKEKADEGNNKGKPSIKKVIVIESEKDPAALDLIIKSVTRNSLELYVAFSLPQFVLDGLETAMDESSWYKWTVIRWGLLEYRLYLPGVFESTIILSPGEVDLKPQGPVIAAKPVKFAVELKLSLHKDIDFGSSAVRQMVSKFNWYASTPEAEMPGNFQNYLANTVLNYEMKTRGAHGWSDTSIYAVHGKFMLQTFFSLFKAIQNRNSVKTSKTKEQLKAEKKVQKKSAFDRLTVSLKTLPSKEVLEPHVNVPCLIPALCGLEEIDSQQQDQLNLFIEIKNALQPATKLASDQIGQILYSLNFAKCPSHFKFNVQCLTNLQMTFMINGVGLANLGIAPFKFERTAEIFYPSTTAPMKINKIDKQLPALESNDVEEEIIDSLALKLSFSIAKTIKQFASSLNAIKVSEITAPFIIPPAWYEKQENGGVRHVKLANPSFNIGFGNDVLLDEKKSSFLATLISSAIGEFSVPGFNLAETNENQEKSSGMTVDNVKLPSNSEYVAAGACLVKSWSCGSELTAIVKLQLPLPESFFLNFNFPEKTKLTLLHQDLPFLVLTILPENPGEDNRLVITKGNNAVLVKVQLNFQGVEVKSQDPTTFEKIRRSFFAKEGGLPVRLRVQIGNEADIETDLIMPFHKLTHKVYKYVENKVRSVADQYYLVKMAVNPNWFKIPRDLKEPFPHLEAKAEANKDDPIIDDEKMKTLSPLQLECISGEAAIPGLERTYRLSKLTLTNTVLFLEKGKDSIEPNSDTNVYFQLMSVENQPVCGLPKACTKLQIILTRMTQPDIKLVGLFSFEAPNEGQIQIFETTFIQSLSLFKAKINLPFSGNYRVTLKCQNDLKVSERSEVEDLKIYVRQ